MNQLHVLQEKVATAQTELDAELATGSDTTAARKHLKDVQAELHSAEEAERANAAASVSNINADRHIEAEKMTSNALSELEADLAKHNSPNLPAATLPAHFAMNIISARHNLNLALEKKQTIRSQTEQLRSRQTDLERKRAELIQRRAVSGGNDEADAAALALIDADLDGLANLIAQQIKNQPVTGVDNEERELSAAQEAFNAALSAQRIQVLRSYVLNLEQALVAAAQALAAAPGVRIPDRYQPCGALKQAVQHSLI